MMLRFGIWLTATVFLLCRYGMDSDIGGMVTYHYIVEGHHVAPWGMLFLCFLWLFLKRGEIKENLRGKVSPVFVAAGLAVVYLSYFIPGKPDFIILKCLTACFGLFAALFGRAAQLPAKLLAVYAFTVLAPLYVDNYLERPYALAAAVPAALVSRALGLPVAIDGQELTVLTAAGESISVTVTGGCAGPATMAVFVGIFALMMMDVRLPGRAAAGVFAFGAAGTWAQSVLRIVAIMAFGCYGGAPALWKAHFWSTYIIFPFWYVVFAGVYFKISDRASRPPARCCPPRA